VSDDEAHRNTCSDLWGKSSILEIVPGNCSWLEKGPMCYNLITCVKN